MKVYFEQGPFGPEGIQKKDHQGLPVKYVYYFAFITSPENHLLYDLHAPVALECREGYVPPKVFTNFAPGQSMGNFDMAPVWKASIPPSGQWPCNVPIPLGNPQYIPVRIDPPPATPLPNDEAVSNVPNPQPCASELPIQQEDQADNLPVAEQDQADEEPDKPENNIEDDDDEEDEKTVVEVK